MSAYGIYSQSCVPYTVYVTHKPRIRTILGLLSYADLGFDLCVGIPRIDQCQSIRIERSIVGAKYNTVAAKVQLTCPSRRHR